MRQHPTMNLGCLLKDLSEKEDAPSFLNAP